MAPDGRTSRPPRTSVWLAERPAPKRTRAVAQEQPGGLDRERITAATVRLLDANGMAKFSMRRLAAELGVTAMSVYWYVDSKDDLMELALDSVEGELTLPDLDDEDADWREQLRQLTSEYRRMLVSHPWVSQMIGQYLNVGPKAMAFTNAAQGVMRRAGLPADRLTGALAAVFQFVYGFGTIEANWNGRCAAAGISTDAYYRQIYAKVEGRPEYADSLALREAGGSGSVEEMRQQDFEVALDLLIAGIEAMRSRP
ncbi:TetR/AcrR family transcriptional regulator [Streptomyces gobiensis]|uniref:TetR/AcrR family transcriptional regulator n=1 Tax=Streptomyces gobiensis TaxID=2875706 RepID=UPI001E5517A4|nr:TetR/AcrR family transcriptional regulator [Streptomyces gobiensis]UGY92450.1 TetR/AcrR family transcriptional regulator [Streptomyces gobiensis]